MLKGECGLQFTGNQPWSVHGDTPLQTCRCLEKYLETKPASHMETFFSLILSSGNFYYLFLRVHFGDKKAPVSFLELFTDPQSRCLLHLPFLSCSQDYSWEERHL